ncbi:MAG: DUF2382 domain-containing protein [Chloroflexota bacterium]|nr:DUF2382 domain-containing protein [Chloroflexota bacterium]
MQSGYDIRQGEIQEGWDVYDSNGDEIGDVSEVGPNYIVVEKGWLFTSDVYIPTSAIASVAEDRIQLNVPKDAIDRQRWSMPPTSEGYASADDASDTATLERREERLNVGTQSAQTGEVRVGKQVVEEEQAVDVPVTREEVRVSSRDVDRPAGAEAFQDEEFAIPVNEERATASKEARVVEELDVEKVARQDTERVTDTVRREEFRVDDDSR